MTNDDFLRAILAAPNDDTTRLVYADWLEEHDDPLSAFLRLEVLLTGTPPNDPTRYELQRRLSEASMGIDPQWLTLVSRGPIEICGLNLRLQCPLQWQKLQLTNDASVRFCESCRQKVYFCSNMAEAQTHAAVGDYIAVDPRLLRSPGDLESDVWDLDTLVMGMPNVDDDELADKGPDA